MLLTDLIRTIIFFIVTINPFSQCVKKLFNSGREESCSPINAIKSPPAEWPCKSAEDVFGAGNWQALRPLLQNSYS